MAKLLVVEDYKDTRNLLERLLKQLGHEVACASSGVEAIAALFVDVPDLIILDHSMPGMSGGDVLREIRASPRTATLPVIMFSAYSDPLYRDAAINAGATAYWVKGTMDLDEMDEAIRCILEAHARSTELRRDPDHQSN